MNLKEEIKNTVHSLGNLELHGDLIEHYSDTNTLEFRTRENGNVGDEEPGQADISEAINTKKVLLDKYPDNIKKVDWGIVDEWVNLSVEISEKLTK